MALIFHFLYLNKDKVMKRGRLSMSIFTAPLSFPISFSFFLSLSIYIYLIYSMRIYISILTFSFSPFHSLPFCFSGFLFLCFPVSLFLCFSVTLSLCFSVSLFLSSSVTLSLCHSVSLVCLSVSLSLDHNRLEALHEGFFAAAINLQV